MKSTILNRNSLKRTVVKQDKSEKGQSGQIKKRTALERNNVQNDSYVKAKAEEGSSKEYDQDRSRRISDAQDKGKLEQENLELKAKIVTLSRRLEHYECVAEAATDLGVYLDY